jgi:hypothetical protein
MRIIYDRNKTDLSLSIISAYMSPCSRAMNMLQ